MWRLRIFSGIKKLENKNNTFNLFRKKFLRSFATKGQGSCELQGGQLLSRSLIRVSGSDSRAFLQGLITNDINHLDSSTEGQGSIYTLLLNHQGRVLFDAFLYTQDGESTLIDCDASLCDKLVRHLKLFRVKRAVEISLVEDLSVWVVYHTPATPTAFSFTEQDSCCAPAHTSQGTRRREELPLPPPHAPLTFGDPRLGQLGWRLILPKSGDSPPPKELILSEEKAYRELRYSLGVGEGAEELVHGSSFPLESNGDYLHGISFQKGCYIGQELTARTHHTGVVRKRLMPFRIEEGVRKLEREIKSLEIVNEKEKSVGKVRGLEGQFGIALIRVEEALAASTLTLKSQPQIIVKVSRPNWWPIQLSKEIHSGNRK